MSWVPTPPASVEEYTSMYTSQMHTFVPTQLKSPFFKVVTGKHAYQKEKLSTFQKVTYTASTHNGSKDI